MKKKKGEREEGGSTESESSFIYYGISTQGSTVERRRLQEEQHVHSE